MPAGTFEAWKVGAQTVVQGKVAGIILKQPPMLSTLWYAEGVGVVRQEYARTAQVELVKLKK